TCRSFRRRPLRRTEVQELHSRSRPRPRTPRPRRPCRLRRRSRLGPRTARATYLARHGFRRLRRHRRCRPRRSASPGPRASPVRTRKLTRQARRLPFGSVSTTELAPSTSPGTSLESLSQTAADALRRALAASTSGSVLSTQVEEDLRSALVGLEAIHSHLEDLVATLLEPRPTPPSLVEAADDSRAQATP